MLRVDASICAVPDFNPVSVLLNKECLRMLQCNVVLLRPYTSTGNSIFQHCFFPVGICCIVSIFPP